MANKKLKYWKESFLVNLPEAGLQLISKRLNGEGDTPQLDVIVFFKTKTKETVIHIDSNVERPAVELLGNEWKELMALIQEREEIRYKTKGGDDE